MSEKKWRRFFKNVMDKEMQEIEGILEEMNSNPDTKDIVAPEALHDNLFAQIREEKERLTDDEKELIRLGKVYKKRRKWNKVLVLVAAVVCALAIGVTSMGGPDRVMEKFGWKIADREQTNIDTDDKRVKEPDIVTEAEAYQQIEDEFGFSPVELVYLPEGMNFESITIADETQCAFLCYTGENEESIVYSIYPNYRTGSMGHDVEDKLIEEYEKTVHDTTIHITEYLIEEQEINRYKLSYEYQNIYYILDIHNIEDTEIEQIISNLYFRKIN